MPVIFKDIETLQQLCPELAELILAENKEQYPDAKFMVAELNNEELIAFFVEGPFTDKILFVTGNAEGANSFIDEYYFVSRDEAKRLSPSCFVQTHSIDDLRRRA